MYTIVGGVSKHGISSKDRWSDFNQVCNMYICDDSKKSFSEEKDKRKSIVKYEELELLLGIVNLLNYYWDGNDNVIVVIDINIKFTDWVGLLAKMFPILHFKFYSMSANPNKYSNVDIINLTPTQEDIKDNIYIGEKIKEGPYLQLIRTKEISTIDKEARFYFSPYSDNMHIVVKNGGLSVDYDEKIVKSILKHHNNVIRNSSLSLFRNIWDSEERSYDILSKLGLYNDWDSTVTIVILRNYLRKVGKDDDEENVSMLVDTICNTLEISKLGDRKNCYRI